MTRLYNDDCQNIIWKMPSESIDLVVTDCPYRIVSGGCTNDAVKIMKYNEPKGLLNHRLENTKKGKLFTHNDIEFLDWLPGIYRVLKEGSHCYVMINARNLKELQQAAKEQMATLRDLLGQLEYLVYQCDDRVEIEFFKGGVHDKTGSKE